MHAYIGSLSRDIPSPSWCSYPIYPLVLQHLDSATSAATNQPPSCTAGFYASAFIISNFVLFVFSAILCDLRVSALSYSSRSSEFRFRNFVFRPSAALFPTPKLSSLALAISSFLPNNQIIGRGRCSTRQISPAGPRTFSRLSLFCGPSKIFLEAYRRAETFATISS